MVLACLIGLIASLCVFGDQLGSLYINRPIILSPLVGLVLGYLHQGLLIGASLEYWSLCSTGYDCGRCSGDRICKFHVEGN